MLGFANRALWRCPTARLLDLYNHNVSASHLDIGPGTGYFLDHCRFPVCRPEITLLDLSPTSLNHAARRIARYAPRTHQANVLEPFDLADRFGSVGMNYVLHCLPGMLATKAAVFRNLRPFLAEGSNVFGSTVLAEGVSHSFISRSVMRFYNRRGIFTNLQDDLEQLERVLDEEFSEHRVEVEGSVALFTARP